MGSNPTTSARRRRRLLMEGTRPAAQPVLKTGTQDHTWGIDTSTLRAWWY